MSVCANCGRALPPDSPRIYCERLCRQTAYRRRLGRQPRGRWHPRRQAIAVIRSIIEDEGAALEAMGYPVQVVRDWLATPHQSPTVEPQPGEDR